MSSHTSAKITLWCNRFIALVVFALIFAMPTLIKWYDEFRTLQPGRPLAILICFYCCVPAVLIALWCIDKLLVNILDGMVFTHKNVSYIRRIRWCCAAISLDHGLSGPGGQRGKECPGRRCGDPGRK